MMMKNFKKFLSSVLAVCLCLTALLSLFSCKKNNNDTNADTDPDVNDVEADSESESTEQDKPTQVIDLFDGTAYAGKLVYNIDSNTLRKNIADAMKGALGVRPDAALDTDEAADSAVIEVLVGGTNRPESTPISGVGENDAWYFVGVVDNKIVINGSNTYMLNKAVEYFVDTVLAGAKKNTAFSLSSDDNKEVLLKNYSHEDWRLNELPYYEGNEMMSYSTAIYSSARLLTEFYKSKADVVKVLSVNKTNETEIAAYVEKLKSAGYTEALRDTLDNNIYITMSNGDETVYMYHTKGGSSVRIVYDPISDSVSEVSTPALTPEDGKGAIFYQYGLNHDPYDYPSTGVEGTPNNGMMYVVKCADNSLLIFDGGATAQMTDINGSKPMEELDSFLREITGTAEGEKVTIAAWVFTHIHNDHFTGFAKFISAYSASYELKAICANSPYDYAVSESGAADNMKNLSSTLNAKYPDIKEIVIHTGQKLTFGDVTLQALYTPEDSVASVTGKASYGQFNNTSIIYKVATKDMSMMILGDAIDKPEDYVLSHYSDETLKCDIVQVAHHAHDGVDNIYDKIKASIYLVPNSYGGWVYREVPYEGLNWPMYIRGEVLEGDILPKYCKGYDPENGEMGMLFFSGKHDLTVGFRAVNGEVVIAREPAEVTIIPSVTTEEDTPSDFGKIYY